MRRQSPFPLPPRKQPVKRSNAVSWRCTTRHVTPATGARCSPTNRSTVGWPPTCRRNSRSSLPPEIQDPRVVFAPGQLQLACRYAGSQLTTIVSLTLEVRLAEEPNTLAVRICGARAGLVPLPLKQFLDHVTESVRRADLSLRWAQSDGDPVALVTFAESRPQDDDAQLLLERIEIRAGEIHLAGRTVPPDEPMRPHPPQGNAAKPSPWRKTGSSNAEVPPPRPAA